MKVRIKYSAHLNINGLDNGSVIDVDPGTTVSELLTSCRIRDDQKKFITLAVNGEKKSLSYTLKNNDFLYLLLPVGGG